MKLDLERLRGMKAAGEKIAVLTAYDYPTARLLDEAGDRSPARGRFARHGRARLPGHDPRHHGGDAAPHARRLPRRHARAGGGRSADRHLRHARGGRGQRAAADRSRRRCGKAGRRGFARRPARRAARKRASPSMGHIGMLPQSVRRKAATASRARHRPRRIDCWPMPQAVERAGAFAMVLELVQPEAARSDLREPLGIPTVGIGSGHGVRRPGARDTATLIGRFPWFHAEVRHAARQYWRRNQARGK